MPTPSQSDFLIKLAELFRAEGDAVTADALMARYESTSSRSICTADHDRVLAWQRKGRRLEVPIEFRLPAGRTYAARDC